MGRLRLAHGDIYSNYLSFVFLKRSGRVAVALQHFSLVKELPSLCLS
jgi:hypothetical protein